ncbi:MAG: hypothetical protein AMJ90_08100 [candidate division Zixibacteria bacterium SM23_73_2]|nr:MAG: hypothetical protein AMJ90_08100 [candidate division Zixibacteria bacterium SM23_73_2]
MPDIDWLLLKWMGTVKISLVLDSLGLIAISLGAASTEQAKKATKRKNNRIGCFFIFTSKYLVFG